MNSSASREKTPTDCCTRCSTSRSPPSSPSSLRRQFLVYDTLPSGQPYQWHWHSSAISPFLVRGSTGGTLPRQLAQLREGEGQRVTQSSCIDTNTIGSSSRSLLRGKKTPSVFLMYFNLSVAEAATKSQVYHSCKTRYVTAAKSVE